MPADGNRRDALQRAYSVFEVKAVDDDGTIRGIATTPTTDRSGDIVMPKGAQFKLPLPLLWQHDAGEPIGNVIEAKVTDKGIEIVAKIALGVTQEIDRAFKLIKAKLVRGLSIGFRSIKAEPIPGSWGMVFEEWELLEISAVTIAANVEATITSVKSFSQAASGHRTVKVSPVASGTSASADTVKIPKPEEGQNVNVQTQIKSYSDARALKIKAQGEIMEASEKSGESLNAEQKSQFDELDAEISTIDEHLGRLTKMQARLAGAATPVQTRTPNAETEDGDTVVKAAGEQRDTTRGVIAVERKLEKGIGFARFVKFMAQANGDADRALSLAKNTYPNETPLHNVIGMFRGQGRTSEFLEKAAVAAAITTNSAWAGALVQYNDLANDFIEYLRPQTIVDRLQLREVPFKSRVKRQTGGGSAGWVGEGKAKPLTSLSFDTVTLDFTKIATIAVLTDEMIRLSTPKADSIVRDELANAVIQQLDTDFIDPANAGTANVKPASITNGAQSFVATGTTTQAGIAADLMNVFGYWVANNLSPATAAWIMSPTTALALSLMLNNNGGPLFPGVSMQGGTFQGLPVIVSNAAGLVGASDGAHIVVLVKQSDILKADDGQVAVDASREASLEMSDAPANQSANGTGASLVSMFQTNSVAIRAERWINWVRARPQAVAYLTGVHWGGWPA